MSKYSFIVPVYNCESYIISCLSSIINQTYTDYEIILVDDGSTDESGAICDTFVSQHANSKVIHKHNGGPASARNVGIRESSGEYIWFIDSDDLIADSEVLQKLDYLIVNNADIDIVYFLSEEYNFDFRQIIRKQERYPIEGINDRRGADLLVQFGEYNSLIQIATSPVNKLFRRQIIVDNGVFFPEQYRCFEEDEFLCKAAYFGKKFYFANEYFYSVRVRPQSVSTTMTSEIREKKLQYRIELVESCLKFYSDKEIEVQKTMNKFYSYYFLFSLRDYFKLDTVQQREKIFNDLKNRNFIFDCMLNSNSKYLKAVALIFKIFGIMAVLKFINRG